MRIYYVASGDVKFNYNKLLWRTRDNVLIDGTYYV